MEYRIVATVKFKGLEKYISQLERLTNASDDIVRKALYKGAEVVANNIKQSIYSLNVDDSPYNANTTKSGPTTIQRNGLIESFGISPMREKGGSLDVKLGFDGYNKVVTERWPKGQPNAMVARSVESGTSWMVKQPFVNRAVNSSKALAEEIMRKTFEEKIREYTE